jgi:hypothetical protein
MTYYICTGLYLEHFANFRTVFTVLALYSITLFCTQIYFLADTFYHSPVGVTLSLLKGLKLGF